MHNWYRRSQNEQVPMGVPDELNDFLSQQEQGDEMSRMIHEQGGIFIYPFKDVKQSKDGSYYINWFEEKGGIYDINAVSVGAKVSDRALNVTPYWEVKAVDVPNGIIYLTPIPPNPMVTGIGAGGKELNEHDYAALRGESDQHLVDVCLDKISDGMVTKLDDVSYMLKGTVPVHFGPNGAQGGWYNPSDTMSNRGGKEFMDAKQIMMADALFLKDKVGLDIPEAAIDGRLDPGLWSELVNGQDIGRISDEDLELLKVEGEDFNNPQVMIKMILEHPQLEVKRRNKQLLEEMFYGGSWWELKQKYGKEDNSEQFSKDYRDGKFGDPKAKEYLHEAALGLAGIYVNNQEKFGGFDPYWHIKEDFIGWAHKLGWMDVLKAYETSWDATDRNKVAWAYGELKDKSYGLRALLSMEDRENNPEALCKILYAIHTLGFDTTGLIHKNKEKYNGIINSTKARRDTIYDYHAKELSRYVNHPLKGEK